MSDPQPCPFCGGVVGIFQDWVTRKFYASCSMCELIGPVRDSREEAIAAWNRIRVVPEPDDIQGWCDFLNREGFFTRVTPEGLLMPTEKNDDTE